MSEYWKSTPKYWCKHCKTFVRDTKLEKTNHEATPKHQGNLQRFLRDLHRGHEREERDKQRAKNEIDRLNAVVSGSKPEASGAASERKPAISPPAANRQATPAERKKQLAQLAEMGVAVPESYRREMAMAGDWQTTSVNNTYDGMKEENGEDSKSSVLNVGVRKRKLDDEEREEAGGTVVRRGWGSTTRTYPGTAGLIDDELDALLKTTKTLKRGDVEPADASAQEPVIRGGQADGPVDTKDSQVSAPDESLIKKESADDALANVDTIDHQNVKRDPPIKQEDASTEPGVVFRKRKAKPLRHNR